jgi:hypothetical protein
MSAFALIVGRLVADPVRENPGSINERTIGYLRVEVHGSREIWRVIAFERTRDELAAMFADDILAVAGECQTRPVTRDGETTIDRTLLARKILALAPPPDLTAPLDEVEGPR